MNLDIRYVGRLKEVLITVWTWPYCFFHNILLACEGSWFYFFLLLTFQWNEKSEVKPSLKAGLCFCQTPLKCQNILGAVFRDLGIRLDRFLWNKFPSVDSEAHSYSAGSKECVQHLQISQFYQKQKSAANNWQHQQYSLLKMISLFLRQLLNLERPPLINRRIF